MMLSLPPDVIGDRIFARLADSERSEPFVPRKTNSAFA